MAALARTDLMNAQMLWMVTLSEEEMETAFRALPSDKFVPTREFIERLNRIFGKIFQRLPAPFSVDMMRLHICAFLSPRQVARLSAVCRAFRATINDKVWKKQCEVHKRFLDPKATSLLSGVECKSVFTNFCLASIVGPKEWRERKLTLDCDVPPVPGRFYELLAEPISSTSPKISIADAGKLYLAPAISLRTFLEMIRPFYDNSYYFPSVENISAAELDSCSKESRWFFITNGSVVKEDLKKVGDSGWELPTLLEATIVTFFENAAREIVCKNTCPEGYRYVVSSTERIFNIHTMKYSIKRTASAFTSKI